jgi:O-antigen biosynthesis protein
VSADETSVASPPSPERLDLNDTAGTLVHSEHLARYLWAAQVAAGADVLDAGCGTGYGSAILAAGGAARTYAVDIDEACVERVLADVPGVEASRADVRELPSDDDSFDLVVCFEVIEHMEQRDAAIREFARVLRPGGTLLISSPNRNTYPPGNEHHVHEYTPQELEAELAHVFDSVRMYRQHAWLGSTIGGDGLSEPFPMRLNDGGAREELFTIAAASHGAPADPRPLGVIGDPFEVKWWLDKLAETRRGELQAGAELAGTRARMADLGKRLLEVERENAGLHEDREAAIRDRDVSLERMQKQLDEATYRIERGDQVLREVYASPSWRVTRPLRVLKRLASGGR